MFVSEDVVEEIRSRNDIVDVISSYVKLQKKGSSHFGLCPFHNEKSPSFSVSQGKQMFYCFGCGEGGNVFSFLMKYESLTFPEALKVLADRAGVEIPELEMTSEEKQNIDKKNTIYNINKEAAKYFHYLLTTPVGEAAGKYFEQRQLSKETVVSFGLGVSSMKSNGLYQYFKKKGYTDDILKETGLFIYDEKGAYDRFRNRVMFPILNIGNKVIGFGGRVMGDGQPKYLNSPETTVFDKGRNLYGLNTAKNARCNNLIICEGYMDVIAMHQAGFSQAVASLGTALTIGQAMLMKRYVKDILVCYDSDGPGKKASLRAITIFREAGLRSKVINMEPYKDADEFIKAEGIEAFQKRIDQAENSFLYEIRMMESNFDINDPDGKTGFLNEIAIKLVEFEEEIERNNYLEAIATRYRVSQESLKKLVGKYAITGNIKKQDKKVAYKTKEKDDSIRKSQRMLLTWISDDPSIYMKIKNYIQLQDFTEPVYKKVAEIMFEQLEKGDFNPATILNRFTEDDNHSEIASVLNTNFIEEDADVKEKERAINDTVKNIKKNSLNQRSRNATDLNELQEIIKLQAEINKIDIILG